mmetsp:Transcript_26931/g.42080  ORF Transcript_26931/g.42080 Transcript_26931/m.42080 type:complete len:158 (+) Transcript_26931:98-571(+)
MQMSRPLLATVALVFSLVEGSGAFVATPALRPLALSSSAPQRGSLNLRPRDQREGEAETGTATLTRTLSQGLENQDLLSAIFGEAKMPHTAKNLADLIMNAYSGSEAEGAPFSGDHLLQALRKISTKRQEKKLTPGSRQLCRAILRSCEPRHRDGYP